MSIAVLVMYTTPCWWRFVLASHEGLRRASARIGLDLCAAQTAVYMRPFAVMAWLHHLHLSTTLMPCARKVPGAKSGLRACIQSPPAPVSPPPRIPSQPQFIRTAALPTPPQNGDIALPFSNSCTVGRWALPMLVAGSAQLNSTPQTNQLDRDL